MYNNCVYIYMLFLLGKQITWFLEIVCVFSPHLCVGFLFLVLYPVRLLLPSSLVPSRPSPIHCPQLFTHNLSSHNLLTHNLLSHNLLTQNFSTYVEHGSSLCVAGVAPIWHWAGSGGALGSQLTPWTPRLLAWQAWHLVTWTFTLRGRRGTW